MLTLRLDKPWAWQHVRGDADTYDVRLRRVKARPAGQPACEYDQEGSVEVEAAGMQLDVTIAAPGGGATVVSRPGRVVLSEPNGQLPTGHLPVAVRHPAGKRGVYRLSATWRDSRYLAPDECERTRKLFAALGPRRYAPLSVSDIVHLDAGKPLETLGRECNLACSDPSELRRRASRAPARARWVPFDT